MALIWFDGFESYASGGGGLTDMYATGRWSAGAGGLPLTAIGRQGQGYYNGTDGRTYLLIPEVPETMVFGCAVYLNSDSIPTTSSNWWKQLFRLQSAKTEGTTNTHLNFRVNSDRHIEVCNNGFTILGTTADHTLLAKTWYYIEIKAYIHDSAGTVEIHVNGVEVLSLTSKDTLNGTDNYVGALSIGYAAECNTYFDDLYVLDTTGSKNNDFLGDVRIDAVRPDGAGTYTDFDPSAGSNYQNVDESPGPDDDTTYNDGDTVGDQDSYGLPALPSPAGTTIYGVKDQITVRKTDAGSMECKLLTVQGGSDYLGDAITLSDTFTTHARIMENNPDDSAAWEDADISGGEIGVEITA